MWPSFWAGWILKLEWKWWVSPTRFSPKSLWHLFQLGNIVANLARENKRVLIIGRKHMNRLPKKILTEIRSNSDLYLLDDLWVIPAVLRNLTKIRLLFQIERWPVFVVRDIGIRTQHGLSFAWLHAKSFIPLGRNDSADIQALATNPSTLLENRRCWITFILSESSCQIHNFRSQTSGILARSISGRVFF